MSAAYDKHVEQALATLEDLSARELETTAAKLVTDGMAGGSSGCSSAPLPTSAAATVRVGCPRASPFQRR